MASPRSTFTPLQRVLHWTHALLIFVAAPLGLAVGQAQPGAYDEATLGRLYDLHRSFGALVLALAAVRLAVRAAQGAPAPLATWTRFERVGSRVVATLLYVLVVLVPLLGWAATSAYRADVSVFDLFVLPPIAPEDRALSETLFAWHGAGASALTALVALHVGAALHHRFVKRDGTFERMRPGA
jgi:cytochrome b561